MAKPALVIDMMTAPTSDEAEGATSPLAPKDGEPSPEPTADPEATIASIRSQLDQLEASLRSLR